MKYSASDIGAFAKAYPRYTAYIAGWLLLSVGGLIYIGINHGWLHSLAIVGIIAVLAVTEPLFKRLQAWAVRQDEADQ